MAEIRVKKFDGMTLQWDGGDMVESQKYKVLETDGRVIVKDTGLPVAKGQILNKVLIENRLESKGLKVVWED